MWSEVCHRERRQPASWTSLGRVAALGAAAGGVAMPQPLRFARCCYTAVIAPDGAASPQSSHRAVLLCTVIASCGAALPQSLRFALCRYTTASHRAVLGLLYHSHRFVRCCSATVTRALRAVPLYHCIASSGAAMHSHRFAQCCSATVTALRAVPLYHSHRFERCWVYYATVIASCGAGSAMPQSSLRAVLGLSRLGNRVVRYRVVGGAGLTCVEVQQQQT